MTLVIPLSRALDAVRQARWDTATRILMDEAARALPPETMVDVRPMVDLHANTPETPLCLGLILLSTKLPNLASLMTFEDRSVAFYLVHDLAAETPIRPSALASASLPLLWVTLETTPLLALLHGRTDAWRLCLSQARGLWNHGFRPEYVEALDTAAAALPSSWRVSFAAAKAALHADIGSPAERLTRFVDTTAAAALDGDDALGRSAVRTYLFDPYFLPWMYEDAWWVSPRSVLPWLAVAQLDAGLPDVAARTVDALEALGDATECPPEALSGYGPLYSTRICPDDLRESLRARVLAQQGHGSEAVRLCDQRIGLAKPWSAAPQDVDRLPPTTSRPSLELERALALFYGESEAGLAAGIRLLDQTPQLAGRFLAPPYRAMAEQSEALRRALSRAHAANAEAMSRRFPEWLGDPRISTVVELDPWADHSPLDAIAREVARLAGDLWKQGLLTDVELHDKIHPLRELVCYAMGERTGTAWLKEAFERLGLPVVEPCDYGFRPKPRHKLTFPA